MTLGTETVYIVCGGCNQKVSIKEAVKSGWKMCDVCGTFICPKCLKIVNEEMGGTCPSYILGVDKHQMDPVEISLDEVINYAKRHYLKGTTGEIIDRIFYKHSELLPLEANNYNYENAKTKDDETKKVTIQEEVWRKFGLVIVKRASGKFITWEPIK